jgi:hypothetical protein
MMMMMMMMSVTSAWRRKAYARDQWGGAERERDRARAESGCSQPLPDRKRQATAFVTVNPHFFVNKQQKVIKVII